MILLILDCDISCEQEWFTVEGQPISFIKASQVWMDAPTKQMRYILAPSAASEDFIMTLIMPHCTFCSWWQSCAIVGGKSNFHDTGKSTAGDIVVVTITSTQQQYSRCQNEWVWLCKWRKNWQKANSCLCQDSQSLFGTWLSENGRFK